MVKATDSANRPRARRVWVALTLASLMGQTGCARLNPFRKPDPGQPVFGTEPHASADRQGSRSTSGDLYADRLSKGRNADELSLARTTAQPADESLAAASTRPKGDDHPAVALESPVSLPALGQAGSTRLVKQSEPGAPADLPLPETLAGSSSPAELAAIPGATLSSVLTQSRQKLDALSTYRVAMSHQERVAGNLNPSEDVILNIRRNPKAVRLEWPAGANQGREVLYAADSNGGQMHVRMANALIPRLSMAPDSPLALRNSRHPITEAGYDTIVQNMEEAFRRQEANDFSLGKIRYEGLEKSDGVDQPAHKVVRVTPTKETWVVYLDADSFLPVSVQATTERGDLLERYVFRNPTFDVPELSQVVAFDPDARWGQPKGLFQRLARSPAPTADESRTR